MPIKNDSIATDSSTGSARKARVLAGAILFLASATACSQTKVSLGEGPRAYVASDYAQVLKRWTREDSLLSLQDVDDLLTVTATYESWDFRSAYVVRYAQDYRLTIEERKTLRDKLLSETKESHLFYVALYGAHSPRWTDLSKPTSSWVVRLIDDQGNESAPVAIEKIQKPGSLERRYFPYTNIWRQAFRIRFPKVLGDGKTPSVSPRATWFGIRFAGPEGNQELHWEIDRRATPADVVASWPTQAHN